MALSTADCKKFLDQIAPEHDLSAKEGWKRTRRYNGTHEGEGAILRDFVAKSGAVATVAECGGELHLVSIGKAGRGERTLPAGHVITPEDVCQFVADCIKADPLILARASYMSGDLSEYEADDLADLAEIQAHAEDPANWCAGECDEVPDGVDPENEDDYGGNLDAFYGQGHDLSLLRAVYTVFMPDHDTAFRYFVPVFDGNRMVLPHCNGD